MSEHHHPEDLGSGAGEATDQGGLTRRQLLVSGAVLGVAATAAGSLMTGEALATGPRVGKHSPPGKTGFPDLGYPMPGDMRPDAPELAARGPFHVGVRGFKLANPDQLDVVSITATNPNPTYDRPLPVQVWYPAIRHGKEPELTTYHDTLGSGPASAASRPIIPFEFPGRALRDAKPDASAGPYPLLIVSHGYPGSNVLLTNITENIASKGYVVVAINHTDSTHADATTFASTLRNRMLDDNFVLQSMADLSKSRRSFLKGMVDADKTAILGYSMGGYGALVAAGAGLTAAFAAGWAPGDTLSPLVAGSEEYAKLLDPRVKALVLAGAWGGTQGAFDAAGLAGVKIPMLNIVGDQDQTAPYPGVQFIYDNAVHSDRSMLIHQQGDHEVIANPAPPITFTRWREYVHYQEPALDNTRTNNVNQHFVTAFLDQTFKGKDYSSAGNYLNPVYPDSNDSNNYGNADYYANYPNSGWPTSTIWRGFPVWSAVGLQWRHSSAT
jgi:predicted dienelactone hydrolase